MRPALIDRLTLGCAVVFVIAGTVKELDLDRFERSLFNSVFFSLQTASLLAPLLAVGEIVIGVGLFVRLMRPYAAAPALFLSLVFASFHTYILASGEAVDCACAGILLDHSNAATHAGLLVLCTLLVGISALALDRGVVRISAGQRPSFPYP